MNFTHADADPIMFFTPWPELVFTEGHGMWLTDHRGKKYLDFMQDWAVNCLGHSPQCVVDALTEQAKKLINPSPALCQVIKAEPIPAIRL